MFPEDERTHIFCISPIHTYVTIRFRAHFTC